AAGMDIEQTSAFLGILADNGIKGSMAGTTRNAMLRDLKKNSEDGAVAVGDQTVALYDADGQMRDMTEVVDDLIVATADMSDEQRDAALAAVFGEQALKGFNSIAESGVGSVGKLADELYNSEGAAKEMADIMQDNLSGALKELNSAFEEAQISIGNPLIPAIKWLTEMITDLLTWFNGLSESTKQKIAIFAALSSVLLVVGGVLSIIVGFIPNIISGFSTIMTVVKAVGLVFSGLSAPVLAAIALIAAAAAAIYIYWEPIKEFFINLWEGIKEVTLQVWENITEGLSNAKDNILEAWESLKEFFSNFWEGIVETWSETIETIQEIWNGLLEFFTGLWYGIKEIFTSSGEEIGNIVQIALDKVVEIFQTVYDFLNQITGGKFGEMVALIQSALTTAWEIVQHIWDYIKQPFENVLQFLKGLVTGDFGMMKDAINNQMSSARDLLSNIWSTIKSNIGAKLKEILTDITSKFTEMVSTATNKANEILSAITSVFSSILSAIVEYLTNAVILVGQFIGQMPGKVIEFTGQMMSAGMGLIQGLISGIKNMGKQAIDAITGVVDGVVNKAKSLLNINSPSKVFEQIGSWTGEGLVDGILSTVKDAERASDKMVSAIIPKNKEIDLSYATPSGTQASLASAVRGTVDVNASSGNALLAEIRDELRRQKQMIVEMDGRQVGRAVRPHINEENAVDAVVRRYF